MTLSPWIRRPGYLNTASFGIPCPAAVEVLADITRAWALGDLAFGSWLERAQRIRSSIARLLSTPPQHVALGTSSSLMLHSIATSLPDGAQVLAPENEHNSNLIPYLNQAHRGIRVRLVPLPELATHISTETTLVSCSAVQSLTGEVADLAAIREATRAAGSIFCLDASQACGWLPLSASSADILVCSMYKWLCAPIGGGFLVMNPERVGRLKPATPSWVACADAFAPPYGTDFRLSTDARQFDLVPNLVSMIAGKENIDAIGQIGIETIFQHDVALANRFRHGLCIPASNSAIVSLRWEGAAAALARAGITSSEWRGNLRVSFHLTNTEEDVDAALSVLNDLRQPPRS